jgi:uncharacterized protein RhaS with RHS repeats
MTKRWMTVDPVKDGQNWYQYCNNDPLNFVDPLGLFNWKTFGTGVLQTAGGIGQVAVGLGLLAIT